MAAGNWHQHQQQQEQEQQQHQQQQQQQQQPTNQASQSCTEIDFQRRMQFYSLANIIGLATVFCKYNNTRSQSVKSVGDVKVSQGVLFGKNGNQ
jgi:hypothetical protein